MKNDLLLKGTYIVPVALNFDTVAPLSNTNTKTNIYLKSNLRKEPFCQGF